MNFLSVVTPPPYIYHGCSTWKKTWQNNFTPVNMTSCGRHNVRKHREIKNGEKYNIFYISYKNDCLYKREATSSESKDYT